MGFFNWVVSNLSTSPEDYGDYDYGRGDEPDHEDSDYRENSGDTGDFDDGSYY